MIRLALRRPYLVNVARFSISPKLNKGKAKRAAKARNESTKAQILESSIVIPDEVPSPQSNQASPLLEEWDRGGLTKENAPLTLLRAIRNLIDQNKGCVCLIQVGGFYEIYHEQALEYAPKLGIKIALRRQAGESIPMSGFPCYQLQKFVKILVQDLQQNVAICDQYPYPQENRFYRKVSRIVTPGTLVDESFMNFSRNNYLAAIHIRADSAKIPSLDMPVGLLWIDVSVGDFYVQETTLGDLNADLSRVGPSEIILSKDLFMKDQIEGSSALDWFNEMVNLKRYFVRYHKNIGTDLKVQFESSRQATRKAIESFTQREEGAMNMIISYLNVNLPDRTLQLDIPTRYISDRYLHMDARTQEALELTERLAGGVNSVVGSLVNTIKKTVTPSGSRYLDQWLKSPILDVDEIKRRQSFVQLFRTHVYLCLETRALLRESGDVGRSLQRLVLKATNPVTHLLSIGESLEKYGKLKDVVVKTSAESDDDERLILQHFNLDFNVPRDLAKRIFDTLYVDPVLTTLKEEAVSKDSQISEGTQDEECSDITVVDPEETTQTPFIFNVKRDFSPELTELHNKLDDLQVVEAKHLRKVQDLVFSIDPKATVARKDMHNRILNVIYVATKARFVEKIFEKLPEPAHLKEKRKTSLVYKPHDWASLQEKRSSIISQIEAMESTIILGLVEAVTKKAFQIRQISRLADFLDITSSFAVAANENRLTCPKFMKSNSLTIREGRHPVVEASLKQAGQMFTANDTELGSDARLWVISGPNMGGKSTFLRQNALIVIMAQIGSFVPASVAKMGIVDRIFTRIGASDDIFSDLSTFMVEMIETSNILRNATSRSLAIVDEIGRGTSGREGLAIAYATLLTLLEENKCRTLFATHFGLELKGLLEEHNVSERWIRYYRTQVIQKSNDQGEQQLVRFDHKLQPGISERSYAFEVAKLAGFPEKALTRAHLALKFLDKKTKNK